MRILPKTNQRHLKNVFGVFALALSACGGGGGGDSSPPTPPPTDTTNPTVGISSPANNAVVSDMVTVEATASDNVSVSKVEFYIDNTLESTDTSSPYSFNWDTTTKSNGDYTLMAKSTDSSGNESGPANITVTVNNVVVDNPPNVSITSPDNSAPLSGNVAISASATDDNQIERVVFQIDGVQLGSPDTVAPYEVSWDTTGVSDGNHTIVAIATDDAGQTDQDSLAVEVSNPVACNDKGEDGNCDDQYPIPTVTGLVSYPGAITGDMVNGGVVQLCADAESSMPFSLKIRFNPNVIGALNTPDDITVDLNDNGPSQGDRDADDNQYCASVTLNITEPIYYPYPTEAQAKVALMHFIFEVYDQNGVRLGFQQLAHNFEVDLNPIHSIYVTNPTELVNVTDLSTTERGTTHVLSLENAAAAGCEQSMLQQMTNQAYGLFPTTPDPFDQFIMLKAGKSFRHANPQSIRIKDDVDHNSWSNIDNSAVYGSGGRLRAVACMGNDIDFSAALHEYVHPYAFFAPYMSDFHYYQSDVGQVGPLSRRGGIEADGVDFYVQVNVNNTNERNYLPFSNMTLYSMSLIDGNEFGQVRYANRLLGGGERIHVSETTLVDGALLNSQFGSMNPSVATSRKDHRVILVVMSDEPGVVNDAYLSATHWFAEYWAGNHVGEMFNPIAYVSGIHTGSFSWATGYRATMQTQLPPLN